MTTPAHTEAEQSFARAQTALRAGDRKGALSGFLIALALEPKDRTYRKAALNILGSASGYKTLPLPVLEALRLCAIDATLDLQPLSLVIKTLCESDARFVAMEKALNGASTEIENAIVSGTWDWFLSEPILLGVLARATLIGVRLESVLAALRRHMSFSDALYRRHPSFVVASILQLNTARFPWAATEAECAGAQTPMLRALYQPLKALDENTAARLPDVLRAARNASIELADRARNLPMLTAVDDRTSQAVQAQYEGYPYPPWDNIGEVTPTTLTQFVHTRFPGTATQPPRPTILSAGCGTGRGALMLAGMFPDARITALDLSRASLAYASLKAEQLAIRNVTFGVGDILNVSALNTTFDLIESSGVLHHMASPAAGLLALAKILKPSGLMRIALYSERARSSVIAARDVVKKSHIPNTDDGVRQARQTLITLPASHPARAVVDTPEFFTLDGLHDLIFNIQESRFTPHQLKILLAEAGLKFLGFDFANTSVLQNFRVMFSTPSAELDLDKWDAFEQNHPHTFAEMYQLWCCRIKT